MRKGTSGVPVGRARDGVRRVPSGCQCPALPLRPGPAVHRRGPDLRPCDPKRHAVRRKPDVASRLAMLEQLCKYWVSFLQSSRSFGSALAMNGRFPMDAALFRAPGAGKVVRTPTGYAAFIPAPKASIRSIRACWARRDPPKMAPISSSRALASRARCQASSNRPSIAANTARSRSDEGGGVSPATASNVKIASSARLGPCTSARPRPNRIDAGRPASRV